MTALILIIAFCIFVTVIVSVAIFLNKKKDPKNHIDINDDNSKNLECPLPGNKEGKEVRKCENVNDCNNCEGLDLSMSCVTVDDDNPYEYKNSSTGDKGSIQNGKWCLPTKIDTEELKCNPFTGNPVLTLKNDGEMSWECICKDEKKFSKNYNTGDCSVPSDCYGGDYVCITNSCGDNVKKNDRLSDNAEKTWKLNLSEKNWACRCPGGASANLTTNDGTPYCNNACVNSGGTLNGDGSCDCSKKNDGSIACGKNLASSNFCSRVDLLDKEEMCIPDPCKSRSPGVEKNKFNLDTGKCECDNMKGYLPGGPDGDQCEHSNCPVAVQLNDDGTRTCTHCDSMNDSLHQYYSEDEKNDPNIVSKEIIEESNGECIEKKGTWSTCGHPKQCFDFNQCCKTGVGRHICVENKKHVVGRRCL